MRLVLPDELGCANPERQVRLEPDTPREESFEITNKGALPGSVYPVFTVVEYEAAGVHHSASASGSVTLTPPESIAKSPWVWLAGALVLLGLLKIRPISKKNLPPAVPSFAKATEGKLEAQRHREPQCGEIISHGNTVADNLATRLGGEREMERGQSSTHNKSSLVALPSRGGLRFLRMRYPSYEKIAKHFRLCDSASLAQRAVNLDFLLLTCMTGFIIWQLSPLDLVSNTTTVGGDTPAHLYLVSHLKEQLFQHGRIISWADGWWAGFPMFQYYFALPYLAGALLSVVMPLAVAFKLISVAGLVLTPLCAYWAGRLWRLPRPTPVLLALAMVPFLFVSSHTMWGVNTSSTLAGMIANSWSFALLLPALASACRDAEEGRVRVGTVILMVLVLASHFFTSVMMFLCLAIVPLLGRGKGRKALPRRVGGFGGEEEGTEENVARISRRVGTPSAKFAQPLSLEDGAAPPLWNSLQEGVAGFSDRVPPIQKSRNSLSILLSLKPPFLRGNAFRVLAIEGSLALLLMAWWLVPLVMKSDCSMDFGTNWEVTLWRSFPAYVAGVLVFAVVAIWRSGSRVQGPESGKEGPESNILDSGFWILDSVRWLLLWMLVAGVVLFQFGFAISPVFVNVRLWPFIFFAIMALGAIGLGRLLAEGRKALPRSDGGFGGEEEGREENVARIPRRAGTPSAEFAQPLSLEDGTAAVPRDSLQEGVAGFSDRVPPIQKSRNSLSILLSLKPPFLRGEAFLFLLLVLVLLGVKAGDSLTGTVSGPGRTTLWAHWNYSGLEAKPGAAAVFEKLVMPLKGTPGRLANDLCEENNQLGSSRIFELAPYLAGKPVLEGGLVNSALGSMVAYTIQGESSPSCAGFPPIVTPQPFNFTNATRHLALMNVKHFIARTEQTKQALGAMPEWRLVAREREWELYELMTHEGRMVFIPPRAPVVVHTNRWKEAALEWLVSTNQDRPFLVWNPSSGGRGLPSRWESLMHRPVVSGSASLALQQKITSESVTDGRIRFTTTAIGVPHIVKMSWFPNWKVRGADGVYHVSPNFMMVVPRQAEVELYYGATGSDWAGYGLTGIGVLWLAFLLIFQWRRRAL